MPAQQVTGYRLPVPEWEGELRSCCICGLRDNPIYSGESDHEKGEPIFLHRVVIDLCFIDRVALTPREKSQGYAFTDKLEGDRKAKVRMICRECLDRDEETRSVWDDFHKAQQEAGDESEKNWYEILCME